MSTRSSCGPAAMIVALAFAARLASAADAVVVTHVAIVDPGGGPTRRDRTVVVVGDRIAAIHEAGAVETPAGARVLDGTGKYLVPGLWDMHAHVFTHRGDAFFPDIRNTRKINAVFLNGRLLDRKALDAALARLEEAVAVQ